MMNEPHTAARRTLSLVVLTACLAITLPALASTPDANAPQDAKAPPDARKGQTGKPPNGAGPPADAALSASLKQEVKGVKEGGVALGEPVVMTLTVEHPGGSRVQLPDQLPNPRWTLIDSKVDVTPGESQRTTVATLTFFIARPGQTTLPALPLVVRHDDGRATTVQTSPVAVRVRSVLTGKDAAAWKPARPPLPIYREDFTLLWVGLGAGALGLTALIAFLFARRRFEVEQPPPPPRPAHIVAMEELTALAGGDLLERGESLEFYTRMSTTVRTYLGRRYGFPGAELTTTEILTRLRDVRWRHGIDAEDIRAWLDESDRVKFTRAQTTSAEGEASLRRAFSIVELTRQREEDLLATLAAERDRQDDAPDIPDDGPDDEPKDAPAAASDDGQETNRVDESFVEETKSATPDADPSREDPRHDDVLPFHPALAAAARLAELDEADDVGESFEGDEGHDEDGPDGVTSGDVSDVLDARDDAPSVGADHDGEAPDGDTSTARHIAEPQGVDDHERDSDEREEGTS